MQWIKTTGRWFYRTFWYTVVGLIIAFAIGISLLRIYLPDVKSYREDIEQFASQVLDKEVRIASMEAKLSGITPLIIFEDVYLLDNQGKKTIVHFDQALLTIDFFRSIINTEIAPESFTVVGVNLGITRKSNGNFTIQGLTLDELGKQFTFPTSETTSENELATWFFERSQLSIKKSTVIWQDAKSENKTIRFDNVNFDLRNDDERHQLSGTVTLPKNLGRDFEFAFDFKGNILNPAEWFGQVYSKANQVDLVNWGIKPHYEHARLEQGKVDLELWGDWQGGTVSSFTADIDAQDFIVNLGENKTPFQVQKLTGLLDWQTTEQGWKFNLNKFQYQGENELWPETDMVVSYVNESQELTAHAGFVRLDDIKQGLIEAKLLDSAFESILTGLSPQGDLKDLYARYSLKEDASDYALAASFDGLSINSWKKLPGITNMTGQIWFNQDIGRLELLSKSSKVNVPYMFRSAFDVETLEGKIDWYANDYAWYIHSDEVIAHSADIQADAGLSAVIPKDLSSPYLDIQASYKNGKATSVYKYLPVSIMDDDLVKWLDNAFKSGKVTEGGVIYNGRFSGFPYRDYSGTLLAAFNAQKVKLAYQPGWPSVMVNNGDLRITGLGLSVKSNKGHLYNSRLSNVKVSIDDFKAPMLRVKGRARGQSRDMARFLIKTPIAPEAEGFIKQARIIGKYTGKAEFSLPLSKRVAARQPFSYQGQASVVDNELNLWSGSLVGRKITGDVNFSNKGVFADNISYHVLGGKATARVYTQLENKKQNIKFSTQGELDTKLIRDYIGSSMVKKVQGKTHWQGIVNLGTADVPGFVQFFSRLKGVEIDLPSPFNKSSDTEKALDIKIVFPEKDKLPIHVNYSHEVSSVVVLNLDNLDDKPLDRGEIVFSFEQQGEDIKKDIAVLPKDNELLIKGRLLELRIDEWLELVKQDAKDKEVGLTSLNIPMRLDMDYLRIFSAEEDSEVDADKAKDPRNIAPFDGEIQALLFNDIFLGNVRFKMARHEDGLKFSEIYAHSDLLHLEGEGSWYIRNGQHQTNLLFNMQSGDLGGFMSELGYSAVLKDGETQAVIQANWNDSPDRFSVEKLNGSISAVINDGVLSDVKPGAGRLLGLLSITELPRRLMLDFSELRDGLAFKQIVGRIEIKDGDAFTDTLKIISPIALINIEGRTGLATRDFNQQVSVVPSVTGTLPVISWLAWGGQVGVLAFLIEQMIGDQFNEEIATEYEITGSWDKPQIRTLEKPPAPETEDDEYEEE